MEQPSWWLMFVVAGNDQDHPTPSLIVHVATTQAQAEKNCNVKQMVSSETILMRKFVIRVVPLETIIKRMVSSGTTLMTNFLIRLFCCLRHVMFAFRIYEGCVYMVLILWWEETRFLMRMNCAVFETLARNIVWKCTAYIQAALECRTWLSKSSRLETIWITNISLSTSTSSLCKTRARWNIFFLK